MTIIRKTHRQARFVTIDIEGLEVKGMSWEAKGLWSYLMSRPDNWQVSVAHLIKNFPAGEQKIYRMLNELCSFGYLRKWQIRENGRFKSYEYEVLEISVATTQDSEKIKIILPLHEKPDAAKPDAVFQGVNKEGYKTKKEQQQQQRQQHMPAAPVVVVPLQAKPKAQPAAQQTPAAEQVNSKPAPDNPPALSPDSPEKKEAMALLAPFKLTGAILQAYLGVDINDLRKSILAYEQFVLKASADKNPIRNPKAALARAIKEKWVPNETPLSKEQVAQAQSVENSKKLSMAQESKEYAQKMHDKLNSKFNEHNSFRVCDLYVEVKQGRYYMQLVYGDEDCDFKSSFDKYIKCTYS